MLVRAAPVPALLTLATVVASCDDPAAWPVTAARPPAGAPVQCAAPVRPTGPGPTDWPLYNRTGDRRGVDASVSTVKAMAPSWGARLDGAMTAQPLIAGGLVIAATEHDSVFAFDAGSGCLAWSTTLGPALDVNRHKLICNNITPELGITATPAVDVAAGTVYVVAFLDPDATSWMRSIWAPAPCAGGTRSSCPTATCSSS